jgi:hypothetical protein
MKMIDLKQKMDETTLGTKPVEAEGPRYPYNMRLTFEGDLLEQMKGMENYKIGENVKIEGLGEVVSISKNEAGTRVEIQIQQVGISSKESFDESFDEAAKQSGDTWSRFHERAEREEASTKIV